MRVAVTGGNGVLGRALAALRPNWVYLSRAECDVRDARQMYAKLAELKPQVVLHAAALTDHQHPNAAEVIATNIVGTQHLARICALLSARVVYASTHYVYEGARGDYDERDDPRPVGAYAWSKWAAEQAIWAANTQYRALVVRGSWYTRETRLNRWAARGALSDAWCSREPVAHAAAKIAALIESGERGVVNIGGARRTFAQILRDEGYTGFKEKTLHQTNWASTERRGYAFPADSSVNTAKFDALGLKW